MDHKAETNQNRQNHPKISIFQFLICSFRYPHFLHSTQKAIVMRSTAQCLTATKHGGSTKTQTKGTSIKNVCVCVCVCLISQQELTGTFTLGLMLRTTIYVAVLNIILKRCTHHVGVCVLPLLMSWYSSHSCLWTCLFGYQMVQDS